MTIALGLYEQYTHNGITNNCDLIEKCESIATSIDYGEDPENDYTDVNIYVFDDNSCICWYPTMDVIIKPVVFD